MNALSKTNSIAPAEALPVRQKSEFVKKLKDGKFLLLLVIPTVICLALFYYLPMYGDVYKRQVYSNIYRPQPASGSANIEEPIKLPILMYHQISEKPKKWGKYVVSPKELEHDIKLVLDRGFTPITVSELVAYVNGEGTLPKKDVYKRQVMVAPMRRRIRSDAFFIFCSISSNDPTIWRA